MAKAPNPNIPALAAPNFPPPITGESRLAWTYLARLHYAVCVNDLADSEREAWLAMDKVSLTLAADILREMAADRELKLAELTDLFGNTIARLDLGATVGSVPTFKVSDGRPEIAFWVLAAAVRYLHDAGGVVVTYSELITAVLKRLINRMIGFKTCEFALRHEEEDRMIRFAVTLPRLAAQSERLEYSSPRWEAGALFHRELVFHAFATDTTNAAGLFVKTISICRMNREGKMRSYAVELLFDREPSKTSHTPRRLLACVLAHVAPARALAMRVYSSTPEVEDSPPTLVQIWVERKTPDEPLQVVYQPDNGPFPHWVEQLTNMVPMAWFEDPLGVMSLRLGKYQKATDAARNSLALIAQLEREP